MIKWPNMSILHPGQSALHVCFGGGKEQDRSWLAHACAFFFCPRLPSPWLLPWALPWALPWPLPWALPWALSAESFHQLWVFLVCSFLSFFGASFSSSNELSSEEVQCFLFGFVLPFSCHSRWCFSAAAMMSWSDNFFELEARFNALCVSVSVVLASRLEELDDTSRLEDVAFVFSHPCLLSLSPCPCWRPVGPSRASAKDCISSPESECWSS